MRLPSDCDCAHELLEVCAFFLFIEVLIILALIIGG